MRVARPSRWWHWVTLAIGLLLVVWLVVGYLVIVDPTVNHPPRQADAVVVLGPPQSNGRVDTALSLIRQHVAASLVVSVPADSQRRTMPLCTAPQDGFSVTCFQPHPATTRGEAEHVRDLARQHGWTSVVVVTSTYHVSRARMIFDRCLDGKLYLVAARRGISMLTWAYQYLYQTGAYVKAVLQPGC